VGVCAAAAGGVPLVSPRVIVCLALAAVRPGRAVGRRWLDPASWLCVRLIFLRFCLLPSL
jgi:hypothetical protein